MDNYHIHWLDELADYTENLLNMMRGTMSPDVVAGISINPDDWSQIAIVLADDSLAMLTVMIDNHPFFTYTVERPEVYEPAQGETWFLGPLGPDEVPDAIRRLYHRERLDLQ